MVLLQFSEGYLKQHVPFLEELDDAIAFCDFVIDGNGCQPMDKQRG